MCSGQTSPQARRTRIRTAAPQGQTGPHSLGAVRLQRLDLGHGDVLGRGLQLGLGDGLGNLVGDGLLEDLLDDGLFGQLLDAVVLDPPWGGRGYDRGRTTFADLGLDLPRILAAYSGPLRLKLPRSFAREQLPGFAFEELVDERGVVKMLLASRGARGSSSAE